MEIELLQKRRQKLAETLAPNEMVIVFAESIPVYPRNYLEDKNFLYLAGMELPEAVAVFGKQKEKYFEQLFIERENPKMVVWEGKKTSIKEAQNQSGIKSVAYLDEFEKLIFSYLTKTEKCYLDFGKTSLMQPLTKSEKFIQEVRDHFPNIKFAQLHNVMTPLRSKKSDWEIVQLQKAIDVTALGIQKMREKAEVGMMEYELEAMLRYEITRSGLRHIGFKPIIASGINAATLHYDKNNCQINANDLILTDVGAAANGYSADITRTFPVAKKFTDRQKAIYKAVLDTNKEIIEMVRPGISMKELNDKTKDLLAEALIELGLIENKKDYRKYYMHGVGHHLGLDTHDLMPENNVMKEGFVITVEPGLYIPEEKIGVRIEDDVLVTKDGHKILSAHIPKEISDLEK